MIEFNLGVPLDSYREYSTVYCVVSPSGALSNHHWIDENTLGERVTEDTATHVITRAVKVSLI